MGTHMVRIRLESLASMALISVLLAAGCASTQHASSSQDETGSPSYLDDDGGPLVLEPLVPQSGSVSNPLYDFAHVVVPRVVFMNLESEVKEQFMGPTADKFLRHQWDALNDTEPESYPSSERVEFDGGTEAVLIEMPPPQKQAHAHFTLIVFADSGIEYFTLEHSIFGGDEPSTVIGGWTMDDGAKHSNYGAGPPAEKQAFLEEVQKLLE